MSVIKKKAETSTYCYEFCYFTKQSEVEFMVSHSSITQILQKCSPYILFWAKAKNDYMVLLFYLESSHSSLGITSASLALKNQKVWQNWSILKSYICSR